VKRSLALLAIPFVAIGLVACGDDDDNAVGTTGSTAASSVQSTASEPTIATTPDSAAGGETLPGEISLPSLPDITLPGGITLPSLPNVSLPDVSVPDLATILHNTFPNLSDEQVDCLDTALGDVTNLNISEVMDKIGQCDISISDLTGG
jgi:hypothetical protein